MLIEKMFIKDLLVITPQVFEDERGYFFESYNEVSFLDNEIAVKFIQDNQSFSHKGVIRGLHFQVPPFAQTKLVRVLQGEIVDVAVDLRKDSETFGEYYSIHLSEENKKQLLIPKGFAHGFSVLSTTAMVSYKVDKLYNKEYERGIRFDDSLLNIDWKVTVEEQIVSSKDFSLMGFDAID
ncbi:dTDP-4-dehydrorhamnose 3,5-epimerase [Flavobacterium kingsejongi]|uniref:dTDP-4-dehydrorhamnose 3,5-epimerase n=1 Tax=Flavobacterium kingsejongi TaxID=1678728 RepID=A0A2S1LNV9_9FLAO|nr:dTDP-4-dehydrorhamnose 3,5-epimerase [Flavobacterium kingsejongi]AWG25361.1 dTDP-4-dehydrorhamnose 3,5-epimerase [Flavobacterium kingsejongi]